MSVISVDSKTLGQELAAWGVPHNYAMAFAGKSIVKNGRIGLHSFFFNDTEHLTNPRHWLAINAAFWCCVYREAESKEAQIEAIAGYRSMIAAVTALSIDRIFFEHDAPRGPGTANAYLLLDSGVASAPFVDSVNDYINTQGHHGHGDDLQCFAMPETRHDLAVTVYVASISNMATEEAAALKTGVENLIRCAFRENTDFDVKKTWPYSRFSFSQLGREIHRQFPKADSVEFSLKDISSALDVPRLNSLIVELAND